MYSNVWEFLIHPDYKAEFESSYGSGGEWVSLFGQDSAYIQTKLLKDWNNPLRFMTIDTWKSREQYLSFREKFQNEFETLEEKYVGFILSEQFLGDFELLE